MEKITDLKDLMIEQLRDIYNAEVKFDEFLPQLYQHATDPKLKELINTYLHENKGQVMRLRQVFDEHLFVDGEGETCDAMKAMLKEAEDIVHRSADDLVRDAGIIAALQHIIHYEIASYGAVSTYANMLGYPYVPDILHKNLEEEKKSDRKLAILAQESINERAMNREMS